MALTPLSLLDAFKWRHSVRRFLDVSASPAIKEVVEKAIEKANATTTPFTEPSALRPGPVGLGGSGRHEIGFLLPLVPLSTTSAMRERASINAAFRGQLAVMDLARFHVSTLWLGFYKMWAADKVYPGFKSVVSICYGLGECEQRAARSELLKMVLGHRRRMSIPELFYDVENKRPFTDDNTDEELLAWFRAIQSGPSAMNQQSWRFAIDGKTIHVYKKPGFYSLCDIGIAAANVHLLAVEEGHSPKFSVVDHAPETVLGGRYVVSCTFRD
jgi:hypothetical protein